MRSFDDVTREAQALRRHNPGVRTAWVALTGAPCGGKSTILAELSRRGYQTIPEQARAYIQKKLHEGRTLAEIVREPRRLADTIYAMNLEIVDRVDPTQMVVFDRSVPDVAVFSWLDRVWSTRYLAGAIKYQFKLALAFDYVAPRYDQTVYHSPSQIYESRVLCEGLYHALGTTVMAVPPEPDMTPAAIARRASAVEAMISTVRH